MSLPPLAIGMGIVTGLFFGVNVRSLLWLCRMPLLDVKWVFVMGAMGMGGDVVCSGGTGQVGVGEGGVVRARYVCCQQIAAQGVEWSQGR